MMICTICGADTRVLSTRETSTGTTRRRQCLKVRAHRFTTCEISTGDVIKLRAIERKHTHLMEQLREAVDV